MPDFSNFFLVLYWRWLVFETSRSTLGTIVSSSHLTPIKNWSQAREGYQVKETKDHQGPMTRKNLLLSELAICVPRCPAVSLLCSPGTATSQFEESRQVSRSGLPRYLRAAWGSRSVLLGATAFPQALSEREQIVST